MNKQQKNYIKAVAGFVLAAIILGAGIMTALYLMREEKGMENLMAPVLKKTDCRHFALWPYCVLETFLKKIC
ncbi:hypothetical protein NIA73_12635 [Anaerobutyricum hallii]|nr:hypothetical protein [Anaerobutyricum hallii]